MAPYAPSLGILIHDVAATKKFASSMDPYHNYDDDVRMFQNASWLDCQSFAD